MILALHRRSGTPIWVNSEHVVTFEPGSGGYGGHHVSFPVFRQLLMPS